VAKVVAPRTGSPANPLDELLLDELLDELEELLLEELLLELLLDELLLDELLLEELLLDELLLAVGSSPPQAASIALSIPRISILRIIFAAPFWALVILLFLSLQTLITVYREF
jgi:hypothetical protein